jgi:arylamine N-acetyltransferase
VTLEETPGGVGDWHLVHDPAGSFPGMAWRSASTEMDAFAERHRWLSTSSESGFVKILSAQRRDASGADILRGLTLSRVGSNATQRVIESKNDLLAVLGDVFFIDLGPAGRSDLALFWKKLHASHVAWVSAGQP